VRTRARPRRHAAKRAACAGQTGGYNPGAREEDLPFTQKDEPATLPRVQELIIICELSPWCTIIKNEVRPLPFPPPHLSPLLPALPHKTDAREQKGVTLGDICTTVWKEYTENFVSDAEFGGLPPRLQEHIKRSASHAQAGGWTMYYSPAPATNRFRRVGPCSHPM
jgi:hypothetical protein